ncbi:MAG: hypothetical protein M1290_03350 [Candidatus Thermoplasmatota archaeon]|jgi:hypothetical protein|nr:hypothetical protein [Candidatus Thermoplasmatota archaeon]MCL5789483.1 hypothetical protein [Candidatus Thermoplasmatota archaeon]
MLDKIGNRLDMGLSITATIKDLDLPYIAGDLDSIPMSLYLHAKHTAFNFFLEREVADKNILLREYNPVYYGNFVMVTQKVALPVMRTLYQNIFSVPSMILDHFYMCKGELHVGYRFHNLDLERVTALAKTLISLGKDVSVSKVGRSRGLRTGLDDIDARLPLTVIQFKYEDKVTGEHISEWRGISDPFGSVSYGKDGLGKIEFLDFSESAISPLFRVLLKDQIQPVTYLEEHKGTSVKSTLFIPSLLTRSFLVRYFNLGEDVNGLQLEGISQYSEIREDL